MDYKEQEYRQNVWAFLRDLQPDVTCEVQAMCKPENCELFIQCVKWYMDTTPWQGWLSFNADYTKFYKVHPIDFGIPKKFRRMADKSDKK